MAQVSPEELYRGSIKGNLSSDDPKAKALTFALDSRKFEIELYWKRAAYFWTFCGAALVAYVTVSGNKEIENKANALLLVTCLGLVFSIAWWCVNRASKHWQLNWEYHVDMLEDEAIGPVYKTVFQERPRFWSLTAAYPFSVSRINQLLSLYVSFIFAALVADTLVHHFRLTLRAEWFPTACLTLTAAFLLSFLWRGRIRFEKKILAVQRKTTLAGYNSAP